MKRKNLAIIAIGLLFATLIFPTHPQKLSANAKASDAPNINTNAEYSNGTVPTGIGDLTLWYVWINTSNIQTIFLAYYSYIVNPPVITFLGQHYFTENNTEIFVGNTLSAMEVYNDTNKNGLPDADYSTATTEIAYYFFVNSSVSFEFDHIEKTTIQDLPHYTWGIRYQTIDGFLINEDQSPAAKLMIDYMEFSYDFYIQNNVSYVKTNFEIGKILEITPFNDIPVTIEGLSLALFYGTAVIAAKPYVTLVDGNPYDSTQAPALTEPAETGQIKIENAPAYEFLFGQNYSLIDDTQQENTYTSQCAAVSNKSVSDNFQRGLETVLSFMENALTDLFPKISNMQAAISLDYSVSSFLYRVCYPVWNGLQLEHDPTYVAFLGGTIIPELMPPLLFLIMAATIGTIALIGATIDLKKSRKTLKYLAPTPATNAA